MSLCPHALVSVAAIAAFSGAAFAEPPAGPQQAAAGGAARVLVIPLSTINVPESAQWVARGVQEDLIADLGHGGMYSPIAFMGQVIVEDNATAARLARSASAALAVRGAAQAVNGQIRLTAQLIDAKSGDTVSTASVTGPLNDLLKLEDDLSAQLRGLPAAAPVTAANANTPATTPGATPPATAPTQAPILIQQPAVQPQIIVISQPAQPSYSDYYADYGYPYGYPYGWGYGWWWPGVVYNINNGHHDHHHRPDGHPSAPQPGPTPHFNMSTSLPLARGQPLPLPVSGGGGVVRQTMPAPRLSAGGGATRFVGTQTFGK